MPVEMRLLQHWNREQAARVRERDNRERDSFEDWRGTRRATEVYENLILILEEAKPTPPLHRGRRWSEAEPRLEAHKKTGRVNPAVPKTEAAMNRYYDLPDDVVPEFAQPERLPPVAPAWLHKCSMLAALTLMGKETRAPRVAVVER